MEKVPVDVWFLILRRLSFDDYITLCSLNKAWLKSLDLGRVIPFQHYLYLGKCQYETISKGGYWSRTETVAVQSLHPWMPDPFYLQFLDRALSRFHDLEELKLWGAFLSLHPEDGQTSYFGIESDVVSNFTGKAKSVKTAIPGIALEPIPVDHNFARGFPKGLKRLEITGNAQSAAIREIRVSAAHLKALANTCPLLEHVVLPTGEFEDIGIFPKLSSLHFLCLTHGAADTIKGGAQLRRLTCSAGFLGQLESVENVEELEISYFKADKIPGACPKFGKLKKLVVPVGCFMGWKKEIAGVKSLVQVELTHSPHVVSEEEARFLSELALGVKLTVSCSMFHRVEGVDHFVLPRSERVLDQKEDKAEGPFRLVHENEDYCQKGCGGVVAECCQTDHENVCGEALVECSVGCGKSVARNKLANHIGRCESNEQFCRECGSFVARKDMFNHRFEHYAMLECRFRLGLKPSLPANQERRIGDMNETRGGNIPFESFNHDIQVCPMRLFGCAAMPKTKGALVEHLKRCLCYNIVCKGCDDAEFACREEYEAHMCKMESVEIDVETHACPMRQMGCAAVLKSKGDLAKHMRGECTFYEVVCTRCQEDFGCREEYEQHACKGPEYVLGMLIDARKLWPRGTESYFAGTEDLMKRKTEKEEEKEEREGKEKETEGKEEKEEHMEEVTDGSERMEEQEMEDEKEEKQGKGEDKGQEGEQGKEGEKGREANGDKEEGKAARARVGKEKEEEVADKVEVKAERNGPKKGKKNNDKEMEEEPILRPPRRKGSAHEKDITMTVAFLVFALVVLIALQSWLQAGGYL